MIGKGFNIIRSTTKFFKNVFLKNIKTTDAGSVLLSDAEDKVTKSSIRLEKDKLNIGSRNNTTYTIQRARTASGDGVGLDIKAGDGVGTDKTGGDLSFYGGASTGNINGGSLRFYQAARSGSTNSTLNTWTEMFNTEITQNRINFLGLNTLYFPDKDANIKADQSIELILDADNDDTNRYLAIKDTTDVRALFPDEGNLYLMSAATTTGLFFDAINSRISAGSKAAHGGEDANTNNTGAADQAGVNLTIAGGAGTGTGAGGGISFGTFTAGSSGTSVNSTYAEKMRMDVDGNFQINGNMTFDGARGIILDGNTITGVDDSGEFTNDDAHIMTSAAVEDKIQTHYHYQYISFLGNSTVQANGDWEFPGGNGISNHTWTIDSNQNAVTVGSTTISVAQQYQHAGVRVPYAGKLVGVFGAGRNTNADRQFAAGLFVGVPDWGTTNSINATLRSYAAANNESGSYQNRPSKIEDLTRDFDLSAGDMIYPAIRGDGTSADTIQVSMTVVIKTLIP